MTKQTWDAIVTANGGIDRIYMVCIMGVPPLTVNNMSARPDNKIIINHVIYDGTDCLDVINSLTLNVGNAVPGKRVIDLDKVTDITFYN